MIKNYIKTHIRKSGTYRALEIGKNRIENQFNDLKKQHDDLENQYNDLKKENTHLSRRLQGKEDEEENLHSLIQSLKSENNSLKRAFLNNNQTIQDYNNLTVIIPYRKTNDLQREENVEITLNYLSKLGIKNVIISEHSDFSFKSDLINDYRSLFDSFDVIFNNSHEKGFNKAIAINNGVMHSNTPYICIYDMDCVSEKKNMAKSLELLDEGFEIVYPFNRRIKDIEDKNEFKKSYNFNIDSSEQNRDWADGGIVFWNKQSFIHIGMLNEYFSGWGGEDNEIIIRGNLFKLKQIRLDEILYHLYHERPLIRSENNKEQLKKIRHMNQKDVLNEIKKWPWVIEAQK
ncbi:MAG: glycosyltransferase [Methanobacteriaceae archaeon]|nr:glycosyltransferase [Methanobacteriaceae archaeon]